MPRLFLYVLLLALLGLAACSSSIPPGLTPVQPFVLDKYMGKWYEIARIENRFEQGLTQVTAEYTLLPDGTVRVINRGFDATSGEWQQAEGKARFIESANQGALEVSFFGPFYGPYIITALSDNYDMALVISEVDKYAWLLARSPSPKQAQCQQFYQFARQHGITQANWLEVHSCQP